MLKTKQLEQSNLEMAFTIEPMINAGAWNDETWPDDWTAVTIDGKRSAQFEHTLLATETGVEILTARTADSVPFWWETEGSIKKIKFTELGIVDPIGPNFKLEKRTFAFGEFFSISSGRPEDLEHGPRKTPGALRSLVKGYSLSNHNICEAASSQNTQYKNHTTIKRFS
jgi:hypothetical protein